MADSIRQQIIDELICIFGKLTKLYGHKTNLGSNVFEWKTTNFQESDLPGIMLRDTTETVDTRGLRHFYTLTIETESKFQASTTTNIAREVIADIICVLGQNVTLGGLVYNIRPVEIELLNFEKTDKNFGTVLINFEVEYSTELFQPYQ